MTSDLKVLTNFKKLAQALAQLDWHLVSPLEQIDTKKIDSNFALSKWVDLNLIELARTKGIDFSQINLSGLFEQESLTLYLNQFCSNISISVLEQNKIVPYDNLSAIEQALLLHDSQLRQVVLYGDEVPWLIGHTLMSQLNSNESKDSKNNLINFTTQDTRPLGLNLFSKPNVLRTRFELGFLSYQSLNLVARRTHIQVKNQSLLISELFLPESPIYQKDSDS